MNEISNVQIESKYYNIKDVKARENIVNTENTLNGKIVNTENTLKVKIDDTENTLKNKIGNVENNVNSEIGRIKNTKADKTYVSRVVGSVASGSPKGVYSSATELRTAIPNGNNNIYVVTNSGDWYYYDGTTWTSGGKYITDISGALINKPDLTESDHVDSLITPGVYYFTSSTRPGGIPIESGGVLVVFKPTSEGFGMSGTCQMCFASVGYYIRYSTSTGFSEWLKMADEDMINNVLSDSVIRRYNIEKGDSVDDVNGSGIYYVGSSSLPSGLPVNGGGVLIVFRATPEIYEFGVAQMYLRSDGMWIRYRTSSGYTEWSNMSGVTPIGGYDYLITKDGVRKNMKEWEVKSPLYNDVGVKNYNVGDIVPTLPYKSLFSQGRDILYNSNVNAFYSMVENPASDIYLSGYFGHYGTVCSTFTGYLCNQDIYYTTTELWDILDLYEYNGASSLRIGDNMLREGHVRLITDIIVNKDGEVQSIGVAETGGSYTQYRLYSVPNFESQLQINGGEYVMGRFSDYKAREVERIDYPTDCIPNKGHKSHYKNTDTINIYVPSVSSNLYYKKQEESSYKAVTLSTLTKQTVNGVDTYNITHLLNEVGVWNVTTNVGNKPNEILVYSAGSIDITGNTFVVNGYTEKLKPLWYQIVRLREGNEIQAYPAPSGYGSILDYGNKHYIDESGVTTFTVNGEYDGYYVRVMYDTPYGQVVNDSEYVFVVQ